MVATNSRVSLNLRIDVDKYDLLERLRKTGFGLAETERNRSDVYNEILGYGVQTHMLKQEIGDRDFEKLWRILNNVNWNKFNLDNIEKFTSGQHG